MGVWGKKSGIEGREGERGKEEPGGFPPPFYVKRRDFGVSGGRPGPLVPRAPALSKGNKKGGPFFGEIGGGPGPFVNRGGKTDLVRREEREGVKRPGQKGERGGKRASFGVFSF